jgi:hypothetical protein
MQTIIIILLIALYFLPSILGFKLRNAGSIIILNLLLGWTVIGWIVALIWSVSNEKKENIVVKSTNSASNELTQLKKLFDDGVLTKEEFDTEKNNILKK